MNFFLVLLSVLTISSSLYAETSKEELHQLAKSGHQVLAYAAARKVMFNQIRLEKDVRGYFVTDVYCNQRFDLVASDVTNGRLPNSAEFNTEHTWPQSKFSKQFSESTQKSDLHHLFPTGSKINAERGNFPFAEVNGTDRLECIDSQRGSPTMGDRGAYFEPPSAHKGNVARAMFYFSVRYNISIDKTQEHFLKYKSQKPIRIQVQLMAKLLR